MTRDRGESEPKNHEYAISIQNSLLFHGDGFAAGCVSPNEQWEANDDDDEKWDGRHRSSVRAR